VVDDTAEHIVPLDWPVARAAQQQDGTPLLGGPGAQTSPEEGLRIHALVLAA